LVKKYPKITIINKNDEYKIFITTLMLAVKWIEDDPPYNLEWAQISNLDIMELNFCEKEFLGYLDYNIHVSYEEINKIIDELEDTKLSENLKEILFFQDISKS
jgi:hypothetical protein